MTADSGRYAVYYAPDRAAALSRFGAAWLGYDAVTGANLAQPVLAAIAPKRLREITVEPRLYGFHATLKAPFVLAAGADEDMLGEAVGTLARSLPALAAPPLRLACLFGFWTLLLSQACQAIERLAATCVRDLDRFRAPPDAGELARRRRGGLSRSQNALLERWGYPYVIEEFRFHLTLTSRLDREEGEVVRRALAPLVEPLCRDARVVDAISLFHQPRRGSPFRLLHRYLLAGAEAV